MLMVLSPAKTLDYDTPRTPRATPNLTFWRRASN
jgi:cytoplasmic iron level regulating protein YaaA (DUF328/UPF0246 family)